MNKIFLEDSIVRLLFASNAKSATKKELTKEEILSVKESIETGLELAKTCGIDITQPLRYIHDGHAYSFNLSANLINQEALNDKDQINYVVYELSLIDQSISHTLPVEFYKKRHLPLIQETLRGHLPSIDLGAYHWSFQDFEQHLKNKTNRDTNPGLQSIHLHHYRQRYGALIADPRYKNDMTVDKLAELIIYLRDEVDLPPHNVICFNRLDKTLIISGINQVIEATLTSGLTEHNIGFLRNLFSDRLAPCDLMKIITEPEYSSLSDEIKAVWLMIAGNESERALAIYTTLAEYVEDRQRLNQVKRIEDALFSLPRLTRLTPLNPLRDVNYRRYITSIELDQFKVYFDESQRNKINDLNKDCQGDGPYMVQERDGYYCSINMNSIAKVHFMTYFQHNNTTDFQCLSRHEISKGQIHAKNLRGQTLLEVMNQHSSVGIEAHGFTTAVSLLNQMMEHDNSRLAQAILDITYTTILNGGLRNTHDKEDVFLDMYNLFSHISIEDNNDKLKRILYHVALQDLEESISQRNVPNRSLRNNMLKYHELFKEMDLSKPLEITGNSQSIDYQDLISFIYEGCDAHDLLIEIFEAQQQQKAKIQGRKPSKKTRHINDALTL